MNATLAVTELRYQKKISITNMNVWKVMNEKWDLKIIMK